MTPKKSLVKRKSPPASAIQDDEVDVVAAVVEDDDEAPAKPSRIRPQDFPAALEEYENKLITLSLEFETLEKEAYPKVAKIIEGAIPALEAQLFGALARNSVKIEQTILANMYEFLKASPIWETKFVPGLMNQRNEVEALYRQGWRFLNSAHDPKTGIGGQMYHRPKPPMSFEDFKAMYEKMLVDMRKQEASLKQREAYYADEKRKKKAKADAIESGEATPVIDDEEETPSATTTADLKKTAAKKMLVKMKVRAKA
jgi:hypothetical protein